MEHAGVDRTTVGIVVPTGYSFNLDGTAIYLTMASIFIAEALGDPLSIGEQISLLVFMIIASKGAAGVTGAGLATLAGGLASHRPELLDGVGFIVGIDRFMSEARALTNFAGNSVATVLVGHWTDTYNRGQLDRVLAGDDPFDERTMLDDDHSEGERSRVNPGRRPCRGRGAAALVGRVEQVEAEPRDRCPLCCHSVQLVGGRSLEVLEGERRQAGEEHQVQGVRPSYDGLGQVPTLGPQALHVGGQDGLVDEPEIAGRSPSVLHVTDEQLAEVEADRPEVPEPVVDQHEPVGAGPGQQVVGAGVSVDGRLGHRHQLLDDGGRAVRST